LVRFNRDLKQARELVEASIHTLDRVRLRHALDARSEDVYTGAWCSLGEMDEDMGFNRQALEEYTRCRALASARLMTTGDRQGLLRLADADERVATAAQAVGLLSEALDALREDEMALDRLLEFEPRNPRLHRKLALVYQYRSSLYYDESEPNLGDPALALESGRRYLKQAEEMVRSDPNNTSALFSRAVATFRVAALLTEVDPNAAIRLAQHSVQMFDDLIAAGKSNSLVVSRRARAMIPLGRAQLKAGRVAEAQRSAEAALELSRAIVAAHATDAQQRNSLVSACLLAAKAIAASGNFESAEGLLQEARNEALSIAAHQELEDVIPLAQTEETLGTLYARRHRTVEARACYRRLADLWQRFPETSDYVARQKAAAAKLLASVD
jgi:tetratricopeptide (TPR) repeat protein